MAKESWRVDGQYGPNDKEMTPPDNAKRNSRQKACETNGRLHVDPKVTVGNLIQIIVIVVAMLSAYFIMSARVTVIENSVCANTTRIERTVTKDIHELSLGKLDVELREMNRRLESIERKLDEKK